MKCIVCETTLTDESASHVFEGQRYCDSCYKELGLDQPEAEDRPTEQRSQRARPAFPLGVPRVEGMEVGSAGACIALGFLFMLAGVYFLAIAPGESTGIDALPQVLNLQRLTIGETCSIVGAIFLAAGIRPRWIGRKAPESAPDRHTTVTGRRQPRGF